MKPAKRNRRVCWRRPARCRDLCRRLPLAYRRLYPVPGNAELAAALVVGLALAIAAGGAGAAGWKRFKHIHPTPARTVETLKENVEWAQQQTK
jgi:hypothetical protein